METINLNNLAIISCICFFFLGCSSTQLIDVSESDQLDKLLNDIGSVEMKINAKEEVKQLVIKSIVSLEADIRINFVEQIDSETLVIFSSDHWAKKGYGKFKTRPKIDDKKPYPSLFIAKILGDKSKFEITEPDRVSLSNYRTLEK